MPKGGPPQDSAIALARLNVGIERRGDCLLVTSYTPQPKGYIRLLVDGSFIMAHRLVMEAKLGRNLTVSETVDHLCHNADTACPGGPGCWHRRCINDDHLEVTDAVTNWSRGRLGVSAMRRAKTHCPANHPYEPRNLRPRKDGARSCQACHRAREAGRDPLLEPTYI